MTQYSIPGITTSGSTRTPNAARLSVAVATTRGTLYVRTAVVVGSAAVRELLALETSLAQQADVIWSAQRHRLTAETLRRIDRYFVAQGWTR